MPRIETSMSGPFAVSGLVLIAISALMAVASLREFVNVRRRSLHRSYERTDDYPHYEYEDAPANRVVNYLDSASKRYRK